MSSRIRMHCGRPQRAPATGSYWVAGRAGNRVLEEAHQIVADLCRPGVERRLGRRAEGGEVCVGGGVDLHALGLQGFKPVGGGLAGDLSLVGHRFLGRPRDHRAGLIVPAFPVLHRGGDEDRIIAVMPRRDVLLHLVDALRDDHRADGVFLPVDHALLQGGKGLGPLHLLRVGTKRVHHVDVHRPGDAHLEPLEIVRRLDRVLVVGHLAKAVFTPCQQVQAVLCKDFGPSSRRGRPLVVAST